MNFHFLISLFSGVVREKCQKFAIEIKLYTGSPEEAATLWTCLSVEIMALGTGSVEQAKNKQETQNTGWIQTYTAVTMSWGSSGVESREKGDKEKIANDEYAYRIPRPRTQP